MTECVEAHPEYYGVPEDMEDDDDDEETVEEEEGENSVAEQQEEKIVEDENEKQQEEKTIEQEIETSIQLTPEEIKNEELHSTESISQQFAKQE